ncbi:MAG: septum site-determining protein MinD [SAR202 cluster bacterium]|nr:septum site-determining protein MinD [Chloroflexota bacterium]MQF94490.1 septum site-determining protein MinD [SAR202 cluster bacterium]HAA95508.1 septum site-determining protein MinD [Dehalococcoidia bacterium]MBO19478.1 septum site-determining protein MinD [Chloroflexota bacterium]MQG34656.1 septum site-determining protein MinD [SAR202 cluster bacterium]|tara:strand:+ start:3280 stop:4098 length:819 start_codon:yes stop_codon:yes gene_type:complete
MTGRTIVITSGKGGVGKTTTTANIGTGLAMRGHKVVVIDTDIGLRNLDVIMGLENRIVYDLVNVIEGKCKTNQAMIKDKHDHELYLIPAAQTRDKNSVEPEQLRELCAELENDFDYVLIDCPAGIEQGFKNATAAAHEAIIVTTPEVSAIRDADRVIGLLESAGLHRPKLIINRIAPDMVKRGDMMDQKDVENLLAVDVIGLVPADENTVVAANRGVPVVHDRKSGAGAAFMRIAARVDGEDIPLENLEPKTGLFSRFKELVGMNGRAYSHA